MIETNYFKIAPKDYVRRRMTIWLGMWWWTILLPLVILIFLGMHDSRYYIVALAMVFIVYPGVMALVYFNHALSPESALSIIPHKLVLNDDCIKIEYKPEEDLKTPNPQIININDVKSLENTGTTIILHLKKSVYELIEVPTNAINPKDIAKFLEILNKSDILA